MKRAGLQICSLIAAILIVGCSSSDDDSASGRSLVINEIRANIAEDIHAKQYIELRGEPGVTLKKVYMIALDGDSRGDSEKPYEDWGYVDYALSLDGVRVGKNGLILIKNPEEYNSVADPETTLVNDPDIRTFDRNVDGTEFQDGILEHDTVTFMLVQSDVPITAGKDLDADNDGKPDLPSGAFVLDSIGWETGGKAYTDVLLVQSASSPDAATRFYDDTTPLSFAAWANGDIYENPEKNDEERADEVLYDTLQASSNLPPKAVLSPGSHNFRKAPFVLLNEIVVTGDKYIELLSNPAQDMDDIYVALVKPDSKGIPSMAADLGGIKARETGITIVMDTSSSINTGSAVSSVKADISSLDSSATAVLLIYSPQKVITLNTDLDRDDNGILDLPDGAIILDNIGWAGAVYSDISVNEGYAFHAATRYKENRLVTKSAWMYGELEGVSYSPAHSKNRPEGSFITPAGTNFPETASILVRPVLETARTTMRNPDADDAAFWIHPSDSSKSLIIGTQKVAGYSIYDVNGNTLVDVNPGNIRFNNVDVMYGFNLGGSVIDIAVFTDRITNRFAIYKIQDTAPFIMDVTDHSGTAALFDSRIPGDDTAYGEGVYKSPVSGKFYAFATQNGTWECAQFELVAKNGDRIGWNRIRTITLEAGDGDEYAEGFVIDQEYGKAYVAQEGTGIYAFDAEPDGNAALVLAENDFISREGENGLVADLEGMTIYYKDNGDGYLFVSSQGNNTFGVFKRTPVGIKNPFLKSFAVVDDMNGIDGVQETDSIDVTNMPLGSRFPYGAFIVQDGMDTTADPDDTETNFKWLRWEDIAEGLGDTDFKSLYSPRMSTGRR